MARASDPDFLVLHVLRLKGFADLGTVAGRAGVSEKQAAKLLERAATAELVTHREGRISGWSLTPKGRQRHRELIVRELEDAGTRGTIDVAYKSFLGINGDLLEVCTAWQVHEGGLNDHTDAEYDKRVVERLRAVDDAVQPVCADLGAALARFDGYGPRLREACDKVEAGDADWFTKPMIDSYHTVWFELHEDLLATLGIERSKEAGA